MLSFKILTVTKNEYDIIEDFIIYYGSHFGYSNIIIIDNESDHPHVLHVYEKYKPLGVQVFVEHGYQDGKQGEHFTKYMKMFQHTCDWLVPLDTDYFLTISGQSEGLKDNFTNILSNLPKDIDLITPSMLVSAYHLSEQTKASRPTCDLVYFNHPYQVLVHFCKAQNFISTTNGTHFASSINNKTEYCPSLNLFHYHFTGKKRNIERARCINLGYSYISENDDDATIIRKLANTIPLSGVGIHRQKTYFEFIKEKIVYDLFIKYIKRLPDSDEFSGHILHFNIDSIETEFANCAEASLNRHKVFTLSNDEYERLIYSNPPVNVAQLEYRPSVRDYLSKFD
jgi:hypothetical protein